MPRRISDVMRQRTLVELPPSASAHEAAELMCRHGIGSVLVTQEDRLEGIFTERDLVCRIVALGHDPGSTLLCDVMTAGPDTVAPEDMAMDGLHMMHDGGYRHLPVVAEGRVVAVVSRRDFAGLDKARLEEETALWERI